MAEFRVNASLFAGENSQWRTKAHLFWEEFARGLTSPTPSGAGIDEPPRKKQRLSPNGRSLAISDPSDPIWTEYAPLATVDLNISVPSKASGKKKTKGLLISKSAVNISDFELLELVNRPDPDDDLCSLKLSVSSPTHDALSLPIETEPISPLVISILDRVRKLQGPVSKSVNSGVARSRCIIRLRTGSEGSCTLRAQIMWRVGASHLRSSGSTLYDPIWKECTPDLVPSWWWSPKVFYDTVHVPPPSTQVAKEIQSAELECTLYPFQRRAVRWLLEREGATFHHGRLVTNLKVEKPDGSLPPSFRAFQTEECGRLYVSAVHGTVVKDEWALLDYQPNISGGILAEEMGLGKTVELIALICLHKRRQLSSPVYDSNSSTPLTPSGATLIVTPSHILNQWLTELATHAPSLKVLHYKGISNYQNRKKKQGVTVDQILQFDVVVTTYNVLAREIYYADTPPERNLRQQPKHAPRRSPLVLISWWRVCLDEAQMVESGVSNAATVARLIPRVNAWAVTGTPVKKASDDLFGLLIFLRYEPFCNSRAAWNRVDQETFQQIFSAITLRHSKATVRHELRLPPQKRVVITMPFSAVEEQHYIALYQRMCHDCGFSLEGHTTRDDYDPDSLQLKEKMRNWLHRLRQTCLHPQVGSRNRRALGRGSGPLRTVSEVLEVMVDQNETSLRAEERSLLLAMVLRGHIIAFGKSNTHRYHVALGMYLEALRMADEIVADCRKELQKELTKLQESRQLLKGSAAIDSCDEDDEDESENRSSRRGRLSSLRKMLRAALETQHVCTFFVATAYFNLREAETKGSKEYSRLEDLETKYYDSAQFIRKEILYGAHTRADQVLSQVAEKSKANSWTHVGKVPELDDLGGIENRKVLDCLDEVGERLNKMAECIAEWRGEVIKRLLKPLVDEDEGEDVTGEEYENSTKVQDELLVYTTVLRAIISDRHAVVTGQPNFRTIHEIKEAVRHAKTGGGHSPELLLKLVAIREGSKPATDDTSLRGAIGQLRALATDLQWKSQHPSDRAGAEFAIVERHLLAAQRISSDQMKQLAELEKEQELFHSAMNQRVAFYRHLQEISDTVTPYKEDLDEEFDETAYEKAERQEAKHAEKVAQAKTKRRFLMHLRQESENQTTARACVICTEPFETGVITVCGHQYCRDCIRLWYAAHRTCPVCKRRLHLVDFHEVSYKPQELRATEEQSQSLLEPAKRGAESSGHPPGSPSSASSDSSASSVSSRAIYADIGAATLNEIKSIDLDGSYGTKIDTIARHVLWLREHDPGSKSIIFSQYSDFLTVLTGALDHFKIGNTSISKADGVEKFRREPSIECFLLDAKSDSSGLNLVNATHVFLCEPLINTAIELQAIARVHRIGQLRPTTVYMYLVRDTVEEAIYQMSVERRLDHMGRSKDQKQQQKQGDESSPSSAPASRPLPGRGTAAPAPVLYEAALDKANSLEMQEAPLARLLVKSRGGGELVSDADLWSCLFKRAAMAAGAAERTSVQDGDLRSDFERRLRATAAEGRRMAELVGAHDVPVAGASAGAGTAPMEGV